MGGLSGGSGNSPGIIAVGGNPGSNGNGDGIDANSSGTGSFAGSFTGDVTVSGNLNVSGTKNFKIDHQLDPGNKYLYHAALKS